MRNAIQIALCIIALVISFLTPGSNVTAQTIYSAFNDFSGTSNPTPNGVWSYGYSATLGGPLVLYTSTALHGHYDPPLIQWTDGVRIDPNVIKNETRQDITLPLSGIFVIPAADYLYFHPSPEGNYSTVRWTAPASSNYEVAAVFRAPANTCPTTADVHVLHNGVSLFDALVEQSGGVSDQDPRTFTTVLTMVAGDTIDFTVGVGSNGTSNCDRTLLKATIIRTAADNEIEPQSLCNEWNLALDFRVYPDQENPNRDSCGNPDIWHFLQGDENTYPARIPSTYRHLINFRSELGFIPGLNAWEGTTGPDPSFSGQPWIGVNNTGSTYYAPDGIVWPLGASAVHPSGNPFPTRPAIVGWQSPVSGFVSVTGGVTDFDVGGPEDGILWFIDHYDGASNTPLASGSISAGGSQDFSQGLGGEKLAGIEVKQGDYLYTIIDAGTYLWDDTTGLDITIRFLSELSLRIITDSPLPSGTVGVPYSTVLEAAGGTPPYTWSVVAGSLPPGLDLDETSGLISGIPTTAGTFGFTIQVMDSSSAVASKPFAFAPPPPSGDAGSGYTLPINIDPAPDSGGSDPGTCTNYTVTSGSLPPGLSLDPSTGVVSGTPINGGTYTFTIGCTVSGGQNNGQTATKEFTITIYNPAPAITSLDPNSATAGGTTFVLTVNGANFVTDSTVQWNGASRTTTYVSATQLQAEILAADIASAGDAEVTVVNPPPAGGVSNPATFTIIPANQPPTVQAGGPYAVAEGGSIILTATGSDPENNPLTYAWDLDNDGSFETPGQSVTFSAANLDGPSSHTVAVQVTDDGGLSASSSTTIDIQNTAPTATLAGAPDTIDEGQSATFSFSNQVDPSVADTAAGFLYSYDCTGDGTFEVVDVALASHSCAYPDNGVFAAHGRIKDRDGGFNDYTADVTVRNVAPAVGAITAPIDPVAVNTAINTTVNFSDPGVLDTHTAVWNWGDGTTSAGTISGMNGSVSGSHTYSSAGIYTVKVTVTDNDGGSGEAVFYYIVVYDSSAGFVTGGGWITSPSGAYAPDPSLTGRANFGFVAKYKKGQSTPDGQTQFQFQMANLNFHSTSYNWLVVAGAKAQYKGTGTINGSGTYGFLITAIDGALNGGGGSDRFRIKIWDKNNGDTIVYDNKMGESEDSDAATTIGGGNIVIHKENSTVKAASDNAEVNATDGQPPVFLPLVSQ